MKYFKQEDFDRCVEFLADKPETVETQQELYKFMHEECHMLYSHNDVTAKNMSIYSRIYTTKFNPGTANWCNTMSDGSQVIWNCKYREFFRLEEVGKYQEFYTISEAGMRRCSCLNYSDLFVEIEHIDGWLLENWSDWRFQETQRQLVAIWNGKYYQYFKNYWRQ